MQINKNLHNVLYEFYNVHETVGCGGFSKVKLATHLLTQDKVAIKIIDKVALKDDLKRAYFEIDALKDLKHENIIKLYQVIETNSMIYMVLEYCVGGELFDYIISRDKIPEDETRIYFCQILSPLAYLHSKGYAHRDLKPENIMLDENNKLKLIDFGLCAQFQDKLALRLDTCCGSPAYAAPELILGDPYIGSEVDIWSLGVLLYTLLCGFLPFDDENLSNLYRKIISGHYAKPDWLSPASVALIARMLETNPARRINTKQLLVHPWVTKDTCGKKISVLMNDHSTPFHVEKDIIKKIESFTGKNYHEIEKHILNENYDYIYATYFLVLKRVKSGKIHGPNKNTRFANKGSRETNQNHTKSKRKETKIQPPLKDAPKNIEDFDLDHKDSDFYSYKSPAGGKKSHFISTKDVTSPSRSYDERLNEVSGKIENGAIVFRTKSLENDLNLSSQSNLAIQCEIINKTPEKNKAKNNESAKNLLGSIEKGIDRLRNILSPAKKQWASPNNTLKPREVKILNNVSTSSLNNSCHILNLLKEALMKKGISVKQKGLKLRGKVNNEEGKPCLTFELEIVFIPEYNMYGIRRKRLDGDSWHYKKICEEILALTSPEFLHT